MFEFGQNSISISFRYAIVTLDGSVLLVDDIAKKKPVHNILWNLQVYSIKQTIGQST